jgi:ligand-binding SRPBCC domain-containing protein
MHKTFSVSQLIQAPAEQVYAVIADYHDAHQRILARPPFVSMQVNKGGTGEGTEITVEMLVLGQKQSFKGVVTEPEPGRCIREAYDTGYVTSFYVEAKSSSSSYATISTDMPTRLGIAGWLEYHLISFILRPAYLKELKLLEATAQLKL